MRNLRAYAAFWWSDMYNCMDSVDRDTVNVDEGWSFRASI